MAIPTTAITERQLRVIRSSPCFRSRRPRGRHGRRRRVMGSFRWAAVYQPSRAAGTPVWYPVGVHPPAGDGGAMGRPPRSAVAVLGAGAALAPLPLTLAQPELPPHVTYQLEFQRYIPSPDWQHPVAAPGLLSGPGEGALLRIRIAWTGGTKGAPVVGFWNGCLDVV